MRTRSSSLTPAVALSSIWGLLLLAFVVTALYFGRSVFVPIALATLITFLLSRLVTRLERWIGRIAAVLVTVIAMFTIFAGASWVIGRQIIDLADKLPDYQANIVAKIRSLKLQLAARWRDFHPVFTCCKANWPRPALRRQRTELAVILRPERLRLSRVLSR